MYSFGCVMYAMLTGGQPWPVCSWRQAPLVSAGLHATENGCQLGRGSRARHVATPNWSIRRFAADQTLQANIPAARLAYKVSFLGERPPLHEVPVDRCPQQLHSLIMACWDGVPQRRPAVSGRVCRPGPSWHSIRSRFIGCRVHMSW